MFRTCNPIVIFLKYIVMLIFSGSFPSNSQNSPYIFLLDANFTNSSLNYIFIIMSSILAKIKK